MVFNEKLFILILFFSFIDYSLEHKEFNNNEESFLEKYITEKIKNLSKLQQANIGAAIISSAPIPIFILIVILNLKDIKILNIMSSFAAGALIGDVFIHNLPEINISQPKYDYHNESNIFINMFEKNELLVKKNHDHKHNHNHSNIIISLVGDFIHNLTDGMAIGAGFNKSIKIGVSLSLSIFFHEIPHEIGDFSYLLKQNMSITNSIISQMITALGSFFGVFLSFKFGEEYSDKILAFASGAFLYLALNTIMGDLKNTKNIFIIFLEGVAFIFGVYILDTLI